MGPSGRITHMIGYIGYIGYRGGKIGLTRWASPARPELGPGWAIKLLIRTKSGQIWPDPIWPDPVWPGPIWPDPVWPGLARLAKIFFVFKRLFGPTDPVFRAGWAVKILARKNRANFGPALFGTGICRFCIWVKIVGFYDN